MGALIIGVIVVGWLAYLLPWYLKNWDHPVEAAPDAVDRFADSMVIVRRGDQDVVKDAGPDAATLVSTPLLRNAAREEIAIQAHTAVRRRRIGLVVSLIVLGGCLAATITLGLPQWTFAVGPVMLICWAGVSHASVRIVARRLDRGLESLARGWDEQTAVLAAPKAASAGGDESGERSIDLSKPIELGVSLPEPMPVAPMTYVNRAPRSVRPIDLAAPVVRATAPKFPVTDRYPQDALPFGAAASSSSQTDDDRGEDTTSQAVGQ